MRAPTERRPIRSSGVTRFSIDPFMQFEEEEEEEVPDELQARLRARLPPLGGRRKTTPVQREVYGTDRARGEWTRAALRTCARYRNRQRDLGYQACGARLAGRGHRYRRKGP